MLAALTNIHVAISLAGIVTGLVVLYGMLTAKRLDGWTSIFLITTVATSVTGFMFPFHRFLPSHGVAILSLLVLPVAIFARYRRHLAGSWRWIYVITAVLALYLNVLVLIVQAFLKVKTLNALAPTQIEMPFKMAQLVALVIFIVMGAFAVVRFRVPPTPDRSQG